MAKNSIEEKIKRRAHFAGGKGYSFEDPDKFEELEEGNQIIDPDEPSMLGDGRKSGNAVLEDVAKRGLVGIEVLDEDWRQLEILEAEPFAHQRQQGLHKLAVMMLKRSQRGDGKKANFLLVHAAAELKDVVAELGSDELTQDSISFYRKEVTVHTAGILKRIAFICKTVGTGGTTFAYRVINITNSIASREVKNYIYQNTANGVPTADSFPVDRINDYPYANKDNPVVAKLTVEIEINASASDWEWEVILSSEERITDVPVGEV